MILLRRAGFTLLEICVSLLIGVMLILLAVPSIAGLVAEQRLKQSFERLDGMVATARRKSITERRTYTMVWDHRGITLAPVDPTDPRANDGSISRLVFEENEAFQLRRPAALRKDVPAEWVFWSNGICEPAQVAFRGKGGSWLVSYDPLTARATFLRSEVP